MCRTSGTSHQTAAAIGTCLSLTQPLGDAISTVTLVRPVAVFKGYAIYPVGDFTKQSFGVPRVFLAGRRLPISRCVRSPGELGSGCTGSGTGHRYPWTDRTIQSRITAAYSLCGIIQPQPWPSSCARIDPPRRRSSSPTNSDGRSGTDRLTSGVVQTQVCRSQEEVFPTGEQWKAAATGEKGWT